MSCLEPGQISSPSKVNILSTMPTVFLNGWSFYWNRWKYTFMWPNSPIWRNLNHFLCFNSWDKRNKHIDLSWKLILCVARYHVFYSSKFLSCLSLTSSLIQVVVLFSFPFSQTFLNNHVYMLSILLLKFTSFLINSNLTSTFTILLKLLHHIYHRFSNQYIE